RWFYLAIILVPVLLVLFLPTIISHSFVSHHFLRTTLAEAGWSGDAQSIQIGWITPLRVRGLHLIGNSNQSEVHLQQLSSDQTLLGILRDTGNLGDLQIADLTIQCVVSPGSSSFEQDLLSAETQSNTPFQPIRGSVAVSNLRVVLIDAVTGEQWQSSEGSANATFDISADGNGYPHVRQLAVDTQANWISPDGNQGFLSLALGAGDQLLTDDAATGTSLSSVTTASGSGNAIPLAARLTMRQLPASLLGLLHRRIGDAANGIPGQISGSASGMIDVSGSIATVQPAPGDRDQAAESPFAGHQLKLQFGDFHLDNFVATQPQTSQENNEKTWRNQLAKLEGAVRLSGDEIVGEGLRASTDFAAIQFDGRVLPMALIGGLAATSNSGAAQPTMGDESSTANGPLSTTSRAMHQVRGRGKMEVDLVAMHQALPGLIPVRDGVRLQSGSLTATFDASPPVDGRQDSQWTINTNPITAIAGSTQIAFDPIQCEMHLIMGTASESRAPNRSSNPPSMLTIDDFEFRSGFGWASGKGDLNGGRGDFQLDFDALTVAASRIVDLGGISLGGNAKGQVSWSADQSTPTPSQSQTTGNAKRWRLSGNMNGRRLTVTIPQSGPDQSPDILGAGLQSKPVRLTTVRLPDVRGAMTAAGDVAGGSLVRLNAGEVTFVCEGASSVILRLAAPVDSPQMDSQLPLAVTGEGELNAIVQILKPLLPKDLVNASGRMQFDARGDAGLNGGTLLEVNATLSRPTLEWGEHILRQDAIQSTFAGTASWPQSTLHVKQFRC
ncbi:MAG: hypothetical protein AAFP69_19070, partial [Planctomycetota bacterium]